MKKREKSQRREFSSFYFCGIDLGFPLYFTFFSPIDPIIIRNFLSWQSRRARINNNSSRHCRTLLPCTRVHGGMRVREMHMHAPMKSGNASAGGDDFSLREIRTAWPRVGANWVLFLFSFILLCGFHSFVFVSLTRMLSSTCAWFPLQRWIQNLFLSA